MLRALVGAPTRKVEIYTVDLKVEFDYEVERRRLQILPEIVEAFSEEEAGELAIAAVKRRHHEIPMLGEPAVDKVHKHKRFDGW